MENIASVNVPAVPEIGLTMIENEPRARDIDLAERLGFARPRKIRDIIERHLPEVETHGVCPAVGQTSGPLGGRPSTEYWLNEEQALLVSILSKAPKAAEVRSMLIKVFVRWRKGELGAPGMTFPPDFAEKLDRMFGIERMLAHKVTEIEKAIPGIVSQSVEKAIMSDPRRAVLDYVSVRQLLDDVKALQKGRQSLNRKIGYALRDLAAADAGAMAAKCPHTGVWLFRRSLAEPFMRGPGAALVKAHNDRVSGQGVLKLVRKEKANLKTPE